MSRACAVWSGVLVAFACCLPRHSVCASAGPAYAQSRPSDSPATAPSSSFAATDPASVRPLIDRYCVSCHSERRRTAGLSLEGLDPDQVGPQADVWEKVVHKLQHREMPPAGLPRPDDAAYAAAITRLETALDGAAAAAPNPGRVPIHRVNRSEYINAIRDLLALQIDGRSLLPADDADQQGFDNIAAVLS